MVKKDPAWGLGARDRDPDTDWRTVPNTKSSMSVALHPPSFRLSTVFSRLPFFLYILRILPRRLAT